MNDHRLYPLISEDRLDEVGERGMAIYEDRLKDGLEPSFNRQFVAIHVDTGDYEVAPDHLTAAKRARAKHPDGSLFAIRVGYPALARIGGRLTRRA